MKLRHILAALVVIAAILTGILMLARCPVEPEIERGWVQTDFEPGRGR